MLEHRLTDACVVIRAGKCFKWSVSTHSVLFRPPTVEIKVLIETAVAVISEDKLSPVYLRKYISVPRFTMISHMGL